MHFDPRTMNTGNGSNQAEPETISRRVATVFKSVKSLKNMLIFIGGNSGPVIGDRDNRRAINVLVSNDDLPSGAAMLDGIVHEIGDGIKDRSRSPVTSTSRSPITVRRVPSCSAAASYNSITSLAISNKFTVRNAPFRAWVSICAIRVSDENIRKTASRSAIVSPSSD